MTLNISLQQFLAMLFDQFFNPVEFRRGKFVIGRQ
jgi:hypothetical protein